MYFQVMILSIVYIHDMDFLRHTLWSFLCSVSDGDIIDFVDIGGIGGH